MTTVAIGEYQDSFRPYKERPFEARVPLNDGVLIPYQNLVARVQNSDYGQHMDTQKLRYCGEGRSFEYTRGQMLTDLGPDVHPIGHQNETARWAASLLLAGKVSGAPITLSDEHVALLMFASSIHDMGESMHPHIEMVTGAVIGDIPAGQKTTSHKEIEKRVRQHVFETLLPDVEPAFLRRVEKIIAHQPEVEDMIVHDLIEAAHVIQSFDTARRAHDHSMHFFKELHRGETIDIASYDGGRKSALLGLHRHVFLSSCDELFELSIHYALIAEEIEPYVDELERYRTHKTTLLQAA